MLYELKTVLKRVEQGTTTYKDADFLRRLIEDRDEEIVILLTIIEEELDNEQTHDSPCTGLPVGALSA